MNIKRAIIPIFFAAFAFATAQDVAPTLEVTAPKQASAGKAFKTTVTLKFSEGLHGYQNPPSESYMIPVKVESVTKGVTLKKIGYPKGIPMMVPGEEKAAMVYKGEIKIPVEIVAPKKAGKFTYELKVTYQQCNEEACFPPASLNKKSTVTVVAAKK